MASSDADVVVRVRRHVADVLRRQRALTARRPIVAAVSGGADSLCLLDTLVAVVPRARRRVVVGHVDHQLRAGSAADAEYVLQIADGYGVAATVATVDVPALAQAERVGVEAAARFERYRALRQMARARDTHLVATGHTCDDSVETVVLHLLRGSGLRGLRGLSESERLLAGSSGGPGCRRGSALSVLRPLIGVSRTETVQYCQARGIRWLTDETNADPRYARNRVRAHLLPVLRTYNPAIDRTLLRTARAARDEDAWLDSVVAARWRRIARRADDGVSLDLAGWRRQPPPIQRRMVRLIADDYCVDDLGFDAVERALAVGAVDGPPRADLAHGLAVERREHAVVFELRTRGPDG